MDRIITIPNILSVLRLAMLGLIIYFFVQDQILAMAITLLVSGATDLADGYIARRFDMITNLGKLLDPVADKFTQATIGVLLTIRYPVMLPLIILLFIKELIMFGFGIPVQRQMGHNFSARWWGKLSSTLYGLSAIIICFADRALSPLVLNLLIWIPFAALVFSLIMYCTIYYRVLVKKEEVM